MGRRSSAKGSSVSRTSTPALVLLTDKKIAHDVHSFDHDPQQTDFGREAAQALHTDPAQVFKTLVWNVDGNLALALAPVSTTIAPKRLAAALGGRRAELAPATVAERLSGSVVGAISPMGLRQRVPVVIDDSVLALPVVFVSAGRRGLEVSLAPADLIEVTSATTAAITAASGHN